LEYLEVLSQQQMWVHSFKKLEPIGYEDDAYDEPPDALDAAYDIMTEETKRKQIKFGQTRHEVDRAAPKKRIYSRTSQLFVLAVEAVVHTNNPSSCMAL
jgi:hypothetical protein